MQKTTMTIKGHEYVISREDVIRVARANQPDSIKTFYVDLEAKRFPPKQLIRLVTGTTKPFDSSNARSALTRLGFTVQAA